MKPAEITTMCEIWQEFLASQFPALMKLKSVQPVLTLKSVQPVLTLKSVQPVLTLKSVQSLQTIF